MAFNASFLINPSTVQAGQGSAIQVTVTGMTVAYSNLYINLPVVSGISYGAATASNIDGFSSATSGQSNGLNAPPGCSINGIADLNQPVVITIPITTAAGTSGTKSLSCKAIQQFYDVGPGSVTTTVTLTITAPPPPPPTAPAAPTGLQVQVTSQTEARCFATIPAAATNATIRIVRASDGAQVYTTNVQGNGTLRFDVTGLVAATLYRFYCSCANTVGTSPEAGPTNFTTMANPAAPGVPASITVAPVATAISHTQIVLTWVPVADQTNGQVTYQTNYRVYLVGSVDPIYTGPLSTLTHNGLQPNTQYQYYIRSFNTAGNSAANSPTVSATTQRAPGAPSNVATLTATAAGYEAMDVTFGYGGPTATVELYRGLASSGPWTKIHTSQSISNPTSTTSLTFRDTGTNGAGLSLATTYHYQAIAVNQFGSSAIPKLASGSTPAVPATPAIPTTLVATDNGDLTVGLTWVQPAPNIVKYYEIQRSPDDATWTTIPGADKVGSLFQRTYTDRNLEPNATYYYRVRAIGYGSNSAYSASTSVLVFYQRPALQPQCPFFLTQGFVGIPRQIANRTVFPSNLDRGIVSIGNRWYRWGLKPQLTAPVLTALASGGGVDAGLLATGSYFCFIVNYDSARDVRSLPGPVSNTIAITLGQRVRIAPTMQAGNATIKYRDIAYEGDGTEIPAFDYWEIYLSTTNVGNAYRVAQLPIETVEWEYTAASNQYLVDATLTTAKLTDGTLRPMEQLFENSLPPAVSFLGVKRNRFLAFGETTFKPTAEQQAATPPASVAISQGATTATFSAAFPITDAIIYKELYLNNRPTGWQVRDVEGQVAYLWHTDSRINAGGWQGAGGTFYDFALAADQSRVYASNWSSSNALRAPYFNPEGFPALTYYSYEFFPEDNTDPNGIIETGDAVLMAKPSVWLYVTGGDEIDYPILQVQPVSLGSGLNNPKTLVRNRNDIAYFLADSGLHRVRSSGVEKVVDYTGNSHMFQRVFELDSINDAVAEWFSREDYYVCFGLNRKGSSGNTDGFIYDEKNNAMFWFGIDRRIFSTKEAKNNFGEYQLMVGDGDGNVGLFLKVGLSLDGVDYSKAVPEADATRLSGYVRSGLIDSEHAVKIRSIRPRMQARPRAVGIDCSVKVYGKNRMDDPEITVDDTPDIVIPFNTLDSRDRFTFPGNRFQQCIVEIAWQMPDNPTNATVAFIEAPLKVQACGASA